MRVSFRLTLITILLVLISITASVIAIVSYVHARRAADELASRILNQTEARSRLEIDRLLKQATDLSAATRQRIVEGRVKADDFAGQIAFLRDAMEITGELTGYFIGVEATGEATGITRLSGTPSVWQSSAAAPPGAYEVREFTLADYPQRPYARALMAPGPDIRARPWFKQAKEAHKSIWTETFVFLGVEGVHDVHGVTYATPVYDADGKLLAVLDADFGLQRLCQFFRTFDLGEKGIAFVIEEGRDGHQQVIAHPHDELLLRTKSAGNQSEQELIKPEEFPDRRVAAFAAHLNENGFPSTGAPIRFKVDGEAYLGVYRRLEGETAPPWLICVILPESEVTGRIERSIQISIAVGVSALTAAMLISLYVSSQIARPLERLVREVNAVGQLRIEERPVVHSTVYEVDCLGTAIEEMKGGLRSFQKFVPADLVRAIVASGKEATFSGEGRTVTIFFSDIVNFTSIAEELTPEQLVERLREYLIALTNEIVAAGGTVDKYIGDSIMAFWNAPGLNPVHAAQACSAAVRCKALLRTLTQDWEAAGKPPFRTRFGIHTGEVVVGNIGSDTRLNYTVIGDAVNMASRLEGLNKVYGTEILISETTYQGAQATLIARPLDYVSVKGKRQPILIYEVVDFRANATDDVEAMIETHRQALEHYRHQNWSAAISLFEKVLAVKPNDRPALLMIDRCRLYQTNPPGHEWDGVHRFETK
jgi:adenylate cyclase